MVKRLFWFFGILLFLLMLFLPGYTKLQELRDKNRALEKKTRQLAISNRLLEQELKQVQSDPVYQERAVREKLGIVRKGEVPIRIVPEDKDR